MSFEHYISLILSCGAYEAGIIDTDKLVVHEEVRRLCESNVCRNYGRTWACPPAIGSLDECRTRVKEYDKMLLYSCKYKIEDSFDFDGMRQALLNFKDLSDRIRSVIAPIIPNCLFLSNEGCGRCAACAYSDAPCRFPEKLQHAIEGYGFIISDLAKLSGVKYINGKNTITYFGGVLLPRR